MFNDFVVLHRRGPFNDWAELKGLPGAIFWETCVRSIVFCDSAAASKFKLAVDDLRYENLEAYKFILAVISGLHSPIPGETEIFGQFRILTEQVEWPNNHWGIETKDVFENLIADCKQVRGAHLTHMGHQSYGSYVRKKSREFKSVTFLGAGQLVQEIWPWLQKKQKKLISRHIYCRRPEKWPLALGEHDSINPLHGQARPEAEEGLLVIAAPIPSQEIMAWAKSGGHHFSMVIDLRGESRNDPLPDSWCVEHLEEVFDQFAAEKQRCELRLQSARDMIQHLGEQMSNRLRQRPFGWDDLWS